MINHPRASQLLTETEAFKDLDEPVILTSGELGIYYINTEKLAQDGGEFEKFGDNSAAMIQHAIRMTQSHPTFSEAIDILTRKVMGLAYNAMAELSDKGGRVFISGGQRRDWLFSGPVAVKLGLPHVSIYKDERIEILDPKTLKADGLTKAMSIYDKHVAIHVADLLTEASSCYRLEGNTPKGWVPALRRNNIEVKDLVSVVTRLQGGERNLAHQGVFADSLVAIGPDFLRSFSKNPERALAYAQDPTVWNEAYLKENGALALLETFNPNGKKLDRAKKFMTRYEDILTQAGKLGELDLACNVKYGKHLQEILD